MGQTSRRNDVTAYPILGPYMDAGRHPTAVERGTFSRLAGVDGRFVGCLRPYPGHEAVTFGAGNYFLGDVVTGLTDISFFKYVLLQRGTNASDELRGFLVRGEVEGVTEVHFVYYDTNAGAWASHEVNSGGEEESSTAAMDVAFHGPFMYIFLEGNSEYPRTVWYDGSTWQDKTMGPQWTTLAAPTVAEGSDGTGVIDAGVYLVAYRFYDSTRDLYSGMSAVAEVTTTADGNEIDLTAIPHPGGGVDVHESFDTIQVFRTISVNVADSQFDGGILYLDNEIPLNAAWTSGNKTGEAGETYRDEELVQQTMFDPWEDVAGTPPSSGVATFYQGCTFAGEAPTAKGGGGGIRWSRTTDFDPENFNAAHKYRGRLGDGVVLSLMQAGEVLYALTEAVIYRIRKSGVQLGIHRLHDGRGITAAGAGHAVGDDLVLLTPLGLAVLNGRSADLQIQTQVDRIIHDDWAGYLSDVVSGYDAYMGASFFINTSRNEALVLWHVTKSATLLKNCHFVGITTGPLPESGGGARAFFVTKEGRVSYPDEDRDGTGTMQGVAGTVSGSETTGGSKVTLTDSAATFDDSVIGAYVLAVTGDNAGEYQRITARPSATSLTVTAFTHNLAAGDRYVISPVVFEMRLPPLPSSTQGIPILEQRVAEHVSLYATGHSGITDNPNALWKVSAYVDGASTLADAPQWVTMADGRVGNTIASTSPGTLGGFLIEPFVAAYLTGVDFELTGVEILSRMSKGRTAS